MPKVYHIKLCTPAFSNVGISKGWRDNGYEVKDFDFMNYRAEYGLERMQKKILEECREYKPEIIFMQPQNSTIVTVDMAKELQSIGKVVNYTFDVRDQEESQWLYNLAPFISLTCFSNEEDLINYKCAGTRQKDSLGSAIVLQSSCDLEFYHKVEPAPELYPEIVFIGNNYEKSNLNFPNGEIRQIVIKALKYQYGDRFKAYGLGQEGGFLNAHQERQCYSTAKVTFTHQNFTRAGYKSDREYRAKACGIMTIVENSQKGSFSQWHNIERLVEDIDFFLSNDFERQTVAWADSIEVRTKHSYYYRVKEVLQAL